MNTESPRPQKLTAAASDENKGNKTGAAKTNSTAPPTKADDSTARSLGIAGVLGLARTRVRTRVSTRSSKP
ncbi:hypothetical protein AB0C11_42950 [Streptomyces sp. NPDC039016]|uniref:hypothetical protein n=1 Tax=Streptomyces sp. NPDC039016 TaxID=3154330 RepID=UPI0033CA2289